MKTPINDSYTQSDTEFSAQQAQSTQNTNSFKSFLSTTTGYYVMVAVFAVVLWGLTLILASGESEFAGIIALVCAVFGWRAINRIQPSMFLWMSWVGWLIYFMIKLMLAVIVGIFVAPFMLGRWVAKKVNNSLQPA